MKSPWKIETPYDPMYEDFVEFVSSKNDSRTTLMTCVLSDATIDPFSEGDMESNIEQLAIHIRHRDIDYVKKSVQRGDSVYTEDGKKFVICDIIDDKVLGYVVKARLAR